MYINFWKKKYKIINIYLITLIAIGLLVNFWKHNSYDQVWTIGEWLINYSGGFNRRGLFGSLIYEISSSTQINPIFFIQLFSSISYILFLNLIMKCRFHFSKTFLLSPLVALSPILGQFFMRKDIFEIVSYGLCTIIITKNNRINSFLLVNLISIIAILNHESYIFFAIPSIIILIFLINLKSYKKEKKITILTKSIIFIIPSLIVGILVFHFKGNESTAIAIHNSWQKLSNILPTNGKLLDHKPTGAISALGKDIKYAKELLILSTFGEYSFDKFIYTPAAWLFTIFISGQIFVGNGNFHTSKLKANILLIQFIFISPLFFLGWDYGRWIFLWISSSIFFTTSIFNIIKDEDFLLKKFERISPLFLLRKMNGVKILLHSELIYLFISIPACCWTLKKFLFSTPILYPFIIISKAIREFSL